MCIPCVMCGACMTDSNGERADDGRCPECGEPVPNNAVSCPKCFTFLYRPSDVMANMTKKDGANETHVTEGPGEPKKLGKTGEPTE